MRDFAANRQDLYHIPAFSDRLYRSVGRFHRSAFSGLHLITPALRTLNAGRPAVSSGLRALA